MKKYIFIALFFIFSLSTFSQNTGKIQGVVTYTTLNSSASRADVGTKILFKKVSANDTINKILQRQSYFNVSFNASNEIYRVIKPSSDQLKEHTKKKDSLETYTTKAKGYIKKISENDDLPVLSVDGSGNYAFDLDSGFYEVIAVSEAARNSIKYNVIEIKPNKTKVVNFDFLVY